MARSLDERLSASRVRLRARHPFFGALLLFAKVVETEDCELAATDGERLFINPAGVEGLRAPELDGLLLHELLHAALLHIDRRRAREPLRWNVAADIVVNGIIASLPRVALPAGGLRDPDLEALPVEEVYERLEGRVLTLSLADLLDPAEPTDPALCTARAAQWREALAQAETLTHMGVGALPAALARAVREVLAPSLDWRSMLWRFVTVTPCDYSDFDRRLVHRGLYLEALQGDSLDVAVAVDTSGSIGQRLLDRFMGELRGILGAYPHVRVALYFIDAALDGPYEVRDVGEVPAPKGGGGTDFRPFFQAMRESRASGQRVLVYLTDGFGTFPTDRPDEPTLWVVAAGGLASERFPFGEVARLMEN
ncbi:MAG: VWA-like domain-containing protein [Polyangiales bacterium]